MYSKLFQIHRDEIVKSGKSLEEWCSIWWSPLLRALASDNKSKRSYVYEYVLPRLIKIYPEAINYCQLANENHAAVISCTKICRSLGLMPSNADKDSLYGPIDSIMIEKLLVNSDEQTRLDCLALVCDNPKTTEPATALEFALVKKFLANNSDSNSPSYRQCVLASLKKLYSRLKDSWLYQIKLCAKATTRKADFEQIKSFTQQFSESYIEFISWSLQFGFSCLHLDSSFAKRNQTLLLITTLVDIFGLKCFDDGLLVEMLPETARVLFDLEASLSHEKIQSLVECLWDTYAANKDLSLKLLLKLGIETFSKFSFSSESYFRESLRLLSSRKPADSSTSVYILMLLQQKFPLEHILIDWKDSIYFNELENAQSLSIFLVNSIGEEFERHCKSARQNLLLAALRTPIYGPLAAIRQVIVQSLGEIKSSKLITEWKRLIEHLIELAFDVSEVASPIVNSKSPEGIFPAELLAMQPGIEHSELLNSVTPQMLLVCCWRTMKEISLFFGDIVRHLPIEFEAKAPNFILPSYQV